MVQLPHLILSNMCTMCTNCLVCFNKNRMCASAVDHETSEWWGNVIICNETKKGKKWVQIIDILVKEVNDIWGKSGAVYGLVQTLTIITNILLWLILF